MCCYVFFNDTATAHIYTLSLHDALPISDPKIGRIRKSPERPQACVEHLGERLGGLDGERRQGMGSDILARSEEHTSELQSHSDLVCRLLLEKKKNNKLVNSEVQDGTENK